jgi:antirestriction protein ArdC
VVEGLKNDKRAIFTASAKAQEAVDWMNKRITPEVRRQRELPPTAGGQVL